MAERILLGKKGSDYGLFISKPGLVGSIASADREDLLFSSIWQEYYDNYYLNI